MASPQPDAADDRPHLIRQLGLLQASALNMANMVGAGPFITIPILLSTLGGPQAMLGWVLALVITLCDGMVWSELAAAMPGSGGSYVYLREGFGRETFGRLMAFLFIWQFILSGPLEIASAYIGLANYTGYVWKADKVYHLLLAGAVGLVTIALLYRRITTIGWLAVALWAGTISACSTVIVTGLMHFDAERVFDFPPGAFGFSMGFLLGLGAATRVGVYDYLGYYDICYLGDEVKDPGRVMPRAILISLVVIAAAYFAMNLGIVSVVPWREFVPYEEHKPQSDFVVSIFMERVYGSGVAKLFTILILWTIVASAFAMLLGYSRIPYAAAKDGYFFSAFARLHPTKSFPHVSLLVIGFLSIACCAIPLDAVIEVLLAMRILVQFMSQSYAVIRLRRHAPQMERPYRVWLYPLPNLIALVGFLFVFVTNPAWVILFALGVLAAGVCFFLIWSRLTHRWPFAGDGATR